MGAQHEVEAVEQVSARPAGRYAALPRAEVAGVVAELHHGFDQARIRDSVPILVEQEVRRRLERAASHASA